MLFSVIIPVYNRADVVGRTLDSVLAQTYRPLQLVLVDNNSTDRSHEVLLDFKERHQSDEFQIVVDCEEHQTASAARNRGLESAAGEWLLFFDSDDEMLPDLIENYARIVQNHVRTGVDMVSVRSTLVFPDGRRRQAPFFTGDLLANHILHSQFSTQRYAVRRDFFLAVGRWDIDLLGWDDWELGARLLLAHPQVAFGDDVSRVVIYHNGADSITGTDFHSKSGQWERAIDTIERDVRRAAPHGAERLLRLLDFRRLTLGAQYEREGYGQLARPLTDKAWRALRDSYGGSMRWRCLVRPMTRCLYARIRAGKRGSARIARRLF